MNAALDARLLARHALGLDATALIARERDPVSPEAEARFAGLLARRLSGEPVARIMGRKEFYGLDFGLNAATLVPRPETEMLVDFGLQALDSEASAAILDLGTGTGCIALALLAHRPRARALGIDLAPEAAAQAQANAEALGLAPRFAVRTGSWFAPLVEGERFDLIVSNPPYIGSSVIDILAPEVRDHDPRAALDGGEDGLAPYRVLAAGLRDRLNPGGQVAFEIGWDQGAAVAALFSAAGLEDVAVHTDLSGQDRMVTGRLTPP